MEEQKPHFLLVTFPVQSHINPILQFGKRLLKAGALVTFVTSVSAYRRMGDKAEALEGLTFATISDGYDNGFRSTTNNDGRAYHTKFRQRGVETLTELFQKSIAQGNSITCLVYTQLLHWAAEVAREFYVPSALLWIQPASVFDIYYYYFNGYKDVISECENDPLWSLHLPNMPFDLKTRDLPSFLLPSTPLLYVEIYSPMSKLVIGAKCDGCRSGNEHDDMMAESSCCLCTVNEPEIVAAYGQASQTFGPDRFGYLAGFERAYNSLF